MPDLEMVSKAMDICLHSPIGRRCKECPYFEDATCDVDLVHDALALLKEQQKRIEMLESLRRIEQEGR